MDDYSDEIVVGYQRKTKIRKRDHQLPKIDFGKRVIHFGDDLTLFKIVCVLIMKRVDLDPDDLEPMFGSHDMASSPVLDLDEISERAANDPRLRGNDGPDPFRERLTLSQRFGIRWHRGND